MESRIDVLGDKEAAAMFRQIGKEAPFALSVTLNNLANATQAKTRAEVREKFTLRKPTFVLNTIYRKPGEDYSTKTKLEAGVRVNDDPKKDFLAKFETGGSKRPVDGRALAIPMGVKRNKADIVTPAFKVANLFAKGKAQRVGSLVVQFTGKGKKSMAKVLYKFVPAVWIKDMLNMRENAEDVVKNQFETIAGAAIDRALSTAKK